jgi:hypothetical protein
MGKCKNCLLPETIPGADIDVNGVCRFCREYQTLDHSAEEHARQSHAADLEHALQECHGQGEYDCLVCFSGGKDSVYLLYKLQEQYGLRILAFTTNINVPPIAWKNINRAIDKLNVDHVVYTPSKEFYHKLFRFLLQNQEERGAVRTVCYVCAPLFEGYALKLAVEKRIPLVLAGYSPGQPDPERMVYEFPRRAIAHVDWTPPELRDSGLFSPSELHLFWNPFDYPAGTPFPRYLAPFHAWNYSQETHMKKVVELGLVAKNKHANPIHSNCPLNWLLMYSDLKNLGYNPYVPEFSALIREGKASCLYWKIMGPVVNFMIRKKIYLGRHVKTHLDWLDLRPEELVIRRARRPEWPDHVYQDDETQSQTGGPLP